MTSPTRQAAKKQLLELLATKQLRMTTQRQAIIDAVFETDEHFTAEQLLEWARKKDASVSRATVYRTLPILTDSGLVREMDFGKDYKFYDPNYADNPKHDHIICVDCNKVFEFRSSGIEKLEDEITHDMGFSVAQHQLQISANCDELKRLGICKNKKSGTKGGYRLGHETHRGHQRGRLV